MYVNLRAECINLITFFCVPFYSSRTCAILAYHRCLIDERANTPIVLYKRSSPLLVYEANAVQIGREYRKIFVGNAKLWEIPFALYLEKIENTGLHLVEFFVD